MRVAWKLGFAWGVAAFLLLPAITTAAPIHTTYLWHMHQPIYWPERSTWNGKAYAFAHETITLGHSQSDEFSIFNDDNRVRDYQDYPKLAVESLLGLPDAGAQVSFAGSLIQNVGSLADAGWNGGRYATNWYQHYRTAMGWSTSGGRRRLDPVLVSFHHPINPLIDETVLRRMIQAQKAIHPGAWGATPVSKGFFPAEMCFSTRMIPALVAEGIEWSIVPDVHIARACADYPSAANLDNCDPPNRADQQNPAQGDYHAQTISRGVTTRIPVPYALRPHRAQFVDPATGQISSLVVVPAANAMSWNEGYATYGTGEIDAIASQNDPAKPMLVVFAHDGDNAWSMGHSYYNENVAGFSYAAAAQGYEPTTVDEFLADHPVDPADVVHVEDGGWVNADGDFGSPQFINWNWPLVNASGQFDIPNGWAEDERNWAVLTAAVNHVLTAEGALGPPVAARIVDPTLAGATDLDKAWHFLLAGHESGAMYYGTALDFEIKATLASNRAVEHADLARGALPDTVPPTIWIPQRLPWNPGGRGGGSLWGYPGGSGAPMSQDFWVWTFVHDVSGVDTVRCFYRLDADGANPLASVHNETYAGGAEVGPWQASAMTRRAFPTGDVYNDPTVDFTVSPARIAEQWSVHLTGLDSVLVDYYVEATDELGRVRRSPIQHVWIGEGAATPTNPAVSWSPSNPVAGGTLTISYDPVPGALPDATNPVYLHVGHSGWTQVVSPDPAMSWNAATQRFDYTYSIPSNATAVDFVFQNGAGTWDNNGGADWHVPVTGAVPPPWTIDGTLDGGVELAASCGGRDVYAEYDGRWLYVAVPNVGATSGLDHFVFVSHPDSTSAVAAPWAKAGQAPARSLLLGNEDGDGWSGWFNAPGAVVTSGVSHASGSVLEARVDASVWWPTNTPASLRIAFAGYQSPNGGTLQLQVPCGDGDGNLEAAEMIALAGVPVGVGDPPLVASGALRMSATNPARGQIHLRVEGAGGASLEVDLLDLRGARVTSLARGWTRGDFETRIGTAALAPGVYFVAARAGSARATRRVVVLP